jgi:hypothetical protein
MPTNSTPCTCETCPGSACTCGCQDAKAAPKTGCQCGDACKCGPNCSCKRS